MRKEFEEHLNKEFQFIAKIGEIHDENYVLKDLIKIEIYSLTDHTWSPNDDDFKLTNLKENDTITFKGKIITYNKLLRDKNNKPRKSYKGKYLYTNDYKVLIYYDTIRKIRVR